MKNIYLTRFLTLLLVFTFSFSGYSSEPTSRTLEEYRIETEIFRSYEILRMMIATEVVTNFSQEDIKSIISDDANSDSQFPKFLKIINEIDAEKKLTEQKKWELFEKIKREARQFSRQYGMAFTVAYFALWIAETVLFALLVAAGLPGLAVVTHIVPLSDVYLLVYLQIRFLVRRNRTVNSYGGKIAYKAFNQLKKELEQKYGLKGKKTILLELDNREQLNTLVIKKDNYLASASSYLRLNNNMLTLKNLMIFCKKQSILDECKAAIAHDDNQMKKMDVINFIMNDSINANVKSQFTNKFIKSFKTVSHFVRNEPFSLWASHLLHAKNLKEAKGMFQNIPQGLTVFEVFEMLKRRIVPMWLEEITEENQKDMRSFYKNFEKIELESHQSLQQPWSKDWEDRLFNFQ